MCKLPEITRKMRKRHSKCLYINKRSISEASLEIVLAYNVSLVCLCTFMGNPGIKRSIQ